MDFHQDFDFENCVFMPHDQRSTIIVSSESERKKISRWSVIVSSLLKVKEHLSESGEPDSVFDSIESCIRSYNPSIRGNLNILKDSLYSEPGTKYLTEFSLQEVILSIIESVLQLPEIFPNEVKLFRSGSNVELKLNAHQIRCILSNAFFCTFPKREGYHEQYRAYPRINFTSLFDDSDNVGTSTWRDRVRNAKLNKLKCFINYFCRTKGLNAPFEVVTFERRYLKQSEIISWAISSKEFCEMNIVSRGSKEKRIGQLQVNFANKFVGGGTLGNGSAMEEIFFSACPQLTAVQLFAERMGDRDCILMHGFQQFNRYSGYGASFQFIGDYDDLNAINNHVVAMDAYEFRRGTVELQFKEAMILREMNKCYCAFRGSGEIGISSVLSGKWGCGVFNGDPVLKCMIQWMAASQCDIALELNTFGDATLSAQMTNLYDLVRKSKSTVGDIYKLIVMYREQLENSGFLGLETFLEVNIEHNSKMEENSGEENAGSPKIVQQLHPDNNELKSPSFATDENITADLSPQQEQILPEDLFKQSQFSNDQVETEERNIFTGLREEIEERGQKVHIRKTLGVTRNDNEKSTQKNTISQMKYFEGEKLENNSIFTDDEDDFSDDNNQESKLKVKSSTLISKRIACGILVLVIALLILYLTTWPVIDLLISLQLSWT